MTRLGLVVLLMVLLVACGGPTTGTENPPKAPEGVIVGTLKDSSGAPLAGADVTLGEAETLPASVSAAGIELAAAKITKTNAAGQFAFDVTEAGEYTLTTIVGNEGAFTRVTVERGNDGKLGAKPLEMKAEALGGVAGRVGGRGTGVWAVLLGTSFLASTDSEGKFVISRVPAGDYLLAASLLGANGAPVSVKVAPGEITQVSTPLQLGPVITKVEPETIAFYEIGLGLPDTHEEFVVTGSGFGAEIGSSIVRYAGYDVTSAVTSWSDTRIVLDEGQLSRHVEWASRTLAEASFSVVTPAGTARSGTVGYYHAYLMEPGYNYCGPDSSEWFSLGMSFMGSLAVEGVTFAVSAVNGTVRDPATGQAITHVTTGSLGCAVMDIEPTPGTALPLLVTAHASTPANFEPYELDPLMVRLPEFSFEGDVLPDLEVLLPGSNVLRGRLYYPGLGRAASDDGHYALTVRYHTERGEEVQEFPLTLDDGRFEVEIDVPTDATFVTPVPTYRGRVLDGSGYGFSVLGWPATSTPLVLGESASFGFDPDDYATPSRRLYRVAAGAVDSDMIRVTSTTPYALAVLDADFNLRYWTYNDLYWPAGWFYEAPGALPATASTTPGALISPQGLDTGAPVCEGETCIQFEPFGDFYILVDSGHLYGEVEVAAAVVPFADLNEPHNDDPLTAPVLAPEGWDGSETGAIETVGDVDYWLVETDLWVRVYPYAYQVGGVAAVEAHIIGGGLEREAPEGEYVLVAAGEVLRIRSALPGVAGVWDTFSYGLYYYPPEP